MFPLETGVIDFLDHCLIVGANPLSYCEVLQMPVFKPNQYLWDNHLREGEDKVDCYARVMRELMSENMNLRLADVDLKEKMAYRDAIFPRKAKKKDS